VNNTLNPEMNNLKAIDYFNKDWTHNSDSIISRYIQEFPRISSNFDNKCDPKTKPWGSKSDPVFFEN
jgi:hypothetical protein